MDGLWLNTSVSGSPLGAAIAPGGFGAGQLATIVMAIIGLTVVMLSTRRRLRRARANPTHTDRAPVEEAVQRRETARDLEEVMLELDELSREIHGRLNTKLIRLEALIRDADRRIERLSSFAPGPRSSSGLDVTVDDRDIAAGVVAGQGKPRAMTSPAVPGGHEDRRELMYRLADRGTPNVDIAREVGKTIGEVELVLALRRTRKEALARAGT